MLIAAAGGMLLMFSGSVFYYVTPNIVEWGEHGRGMFIMNTLFCSTLFTGLTALYADKVK